MMHGQKNIKPDAVLPVLLLVCGHPCIY